MPSVLSATSPFSSRTWRASDSTRSEWRRGYPRGLAGLALVPPIPRNLATRPPRGRPSLSPMNGSARTAADKRQARRRHWFSGPRHPGSPQLAEVGFLSLRELIVLRKDVTAARMRSRSSGHGISVPRLRGLWRRPDPKRPSGLNGIFPSPARGSGERSRH